MSKEPKRNVYVGHRYVPKVMGEWDKEQSYEGLSIVTHQGTSYTSKKHVPAGIDILDEEYWVVTGNYNAQIEHYRKEVRDMGDYVDGEVDSLTNYVDGELVSVKKRLTQSEKDINERSLNMLTLGLYNDGITDNSYILENILENVSDSVELYFPKGKYLFKKPIRINKTLKIKGQMMANFRDGSTSFLFDLDGYNEDTLAINITNRNIVIEDIYIENLNNNKIHHGLGTDAVEYISYCTFKRIRVTGFKHNFHFYNAWGNVFEQCYASKGYNGFYMRGFTTSTLVNQCYAQANDKYGFYVENHVYSTFTSCASDSNEYGYYINANNGGLVFEGCGSEENSITGFTTTRNDGLVINSPWSKNDGTDINFDHRATFIHSRHSDRNLTIINPVDSKNVDPSIIRENSIYLHENTTGRLEGESVNFGVEVGGQILYQKEDNHDIKVMVGDTEQDYQEPPSFRYIRDGKIVHFQFTFTIDDVKGEGTLKITNLPYKIGRDTNIPIAEVYRVDGVTNMPFFRGVYDTNEFIVRHVSSDFGTVEDVTHLNLKSGTRIQTSGFYFTSSIL